MATDYAYIHYIYIYILVHRDTVKLSHELDTIFVSGNFNLQLKDISLVKLQGLNVLIPIVMNCTRIWKRIRVKFGLFASNLMNLVFKLGRL